jgi:triosephosphate isomerase
MNHLRASAEGMVRDLVEKMGKVDGIDVALCPPSVYLSAVVAAAKGSTIGVGAQNVYHEAKGAFTGELSVAMLADVGCQYVILGHSERRHILGESNQDVCRKVHATLAGGLTPIVCVGETLQEREAGKTNDIVGEQILGSLAGLSNAEAAKLVVAYEPVWAIGTGVNAEPADAERVHADLRNLLAFRFGGDAAAAIRIQYGGSVSGSNAQELLGQENIDGALVGGASLDAEKFVPVIQAAVAHAKS